MYVACLSHRVRFFFAALCAMGRAVVRSVRRPSYEWVDSWFWDAHLFHFVRTVDRSGLLVGFGKTYGVVQLSLLLRGGRRIVTVDPLDVLFVGPISHSERAREFGV